MLLDGVNHIAWISKDVGRLGRFYAEVFEAEMGPTRPHGQDPGETMTVIRIGPRTELNIVTIEGNHEPDRQTRCGVGDASTTSDFRRRHRRHSPPSANASSTPGPVTAPSTTSVGRRACSSETPTALKARYSSPGDPRGAAPTCAAVTPQTCGRRQNLLLYNAFHSAVTYLRMLWRSRRPY